MASDLVFVDGSPGSNGVHGSDAILVCECDGTHGSNGTQVRWKWNTWVQMNVWSFESTETQGSDGSSGSSASGSDVAHGSYQITESNKSPGTKGTLN